MMDCPYFLLEYPSYCFFSGQIVGHEVGMPKEKWIKGRFETLHPHLRHQASKDKTKHSYKRVEYNFFKSYNSEASIYYERCLIMDYFLGIASKYQKLSGVLHWHVFGKIFA